MILWDNYKDFYEFECLVFYVFRGFYRRFCRIKNRLELGYNYNLIGSGLNRILDINMICIIWVKFWIVYRSEEM